MKEKFTKVEQMKLGRWLREHKAIVATSVAGGITVILTACKMLKDNHTDGAKDSDEDVVEKWAKDIDEELFTEIAPAIEDALVIGVDTYHLDRTYEPLGKRLSVDITSI